MKMVKAVTLLELISVIVIMSVAITAIVMLLASISSRVDYSERISMAAFYAQQMMEQARGADFAEVDNLTGTDSPASGYQRVVSAGYCQLSGNNWVASASPTNYKMVNVTVTRQASSARSSLVTIMSDY